MKGISNQSAQILRFGNLLILIDCGESTQQKMVDYGIKYMKISHIFISHLHADHYGGLVNLLNTYNLNQRTNELHIYSPKGLKQIINSHLKHSKTKLNYPIAYHVISGKSRRLIFLSSRIKGFSIPLSHRIPCFGFLFQESKPPLNIRKDKIEGLNIPNEGFQTLKSRKDYALDGKILRWKQLTYYPYRPRSYAYISDSGYDEGIINRIKGFDCIYHESTFTDSEIESAEIAMHSTARQASLIASRANVGTLIIGHYSTRYKTTEIHFKEANEIFKNVICAEPGRKIEILPDNINLL